MRVIGRAFRVISSLIASGYLLVNMYTCGFGGVGGGGGAGIGLLALFAMFVSLPLAIWLDYVVSKRLAARQSSAASSAGWLLGSMALVPLAWLALASLHVAGDGRPGCVLECVTSWFSHFCRPAA
jgi:hypothetical protein